MQFGERSQQREHVKAIPGHTGNKASYKKVLLYTGESMKMVARNSFL